MATRKKLSHEGITALRGKFKFSTGGKPFAEWMADCKREEIQLEEQKFQRLTMNAGGKIN